MGTTLWDEQLICVSSVTGGFGVIKRSLAMQYKSRVKSPLEKADRDV